MLELHHQEELMRRKYKMRAEIQYVMQLRSETEVKMTMFDIIILNSGFASMNTLSPYILLVLVLYFEL